MTEKAPQNKSNNLETIKLMLAFLCVKDVKGLENQVRILYNTDLSNDLIAKLLGVDNKSVRNARFRYQQK